MAAMPDEPSTRLEEDRRMALRARAEDLAPWLRSIPGPGFGTVLALIVVQLCFGLAAPSEEWADFVSILLQAMILWSAMVAARIPKGVRRASGALIAAVVVGTGIIVLAPGIELGEVLPSLISVGLIVFTPLVIILGVQRSIRIEGTITLHVMYGVLSIYLLLGLAFSLVFQIIGDLSSANFFANDASETTANFLYFSFVTMTTVGYGDLSAAEGIGRAFAIALALTGQIYLVTIVALIVSNLGARRSEPGA
jgi:hypothetical protein